MKSMLQGSYDFIHRETGKMIKKVLMNLEFLRKSTKEPFNC